MKYRLWMVLLIITLALPLLRGCKEEEVGINTETVGTTAMSR